MDKRKVIGILLVTLLSFGIVSAYGKGGNPFNELWNYIFGIDTQIAELEARIAELEATESAGLGPLVFDSGWVDFPPKKWKIMSIDPDIDISNVIVYAMGKRIFSDGSYRIHRIRYQFLVAWHLYEDDVRMWREDGSSADDWDEFRLLIWEIP